MTYNGSNLYPTKERGPVSMKRTIGLSFNLVLITLLTLGGCTGPDTTSSGTGMTERTAKATSADVLLTEQQISELQAFLNDVSNNGFCWQTYTRPEEVDLWRILYDGAGFGQEMNEWSEQEQADVLAATPWTAYETQCFKLKHSDINDFLIRKIGMPLDSIKTGISEISGLHYVEKYDAYYQMHGDTMRCKLRIYNGEVNEEGFYIIQYGEMDGSSERFIITLQKTEDDYRFISNTKI